MYGIYHSQKRNILSFRMSDEEYGDTRGHDANWVGDANTRPICPICLCVPRNAVNGPCSTVFCDACWKILQQQQQQSSQALRCPTCRSEHSVVAAHSVRTIIKNLRYICQSSLCNQEIPFGLKMEHDTYRCEGRQNKCRQWNGATTSAVCEQHANTECRLRQVKCEACDTSVLPDEMTDHLHDNPKCYNYHLKMENDLLRHDAKRREQEIGAWYADKAQVMELLICNKDAASHTNMAKYIMTSITRRLQTSFSPSPCPPIPFVPVGSYTPNEVTRRAMLGDTRARAEIIRLLQLAVTGKNPQAQFIMSVLYMLNIVGFNDVKQNKVKSIELLRLAAEQENADAQYKLGEYCQNGMGGFDVDTNESVRLYKLAAEQGHVHAQRSLGVCYKRGIGVGVDPKEAFRWLKLSADEGHADGIYSIAICHARGIGVDVDKKEAFRLYTLAAEKGQPEAMNSIGACHEQGIGVDVDKKEAVRWYKLASYRGSAYARINLGRLVREV
jgi:TPR repeat protein